MDELIEYKKFVWELVNAGDNNFNEFKPKQRNIYNGYNHSGEIYSIINFNGLDIRESYHVLNVGQEIVDDTIRVIVIRLCNNEDLISYWRNKNKQADRSVKINKILNGV